MHSYPLDVTVLSDTILPSIRRGVTLSLLTILAGCQALGIQCELDDPAITTEVRHYETPKNEGQEVPEIVLPDSIKDELP